MNQWKARQRCSFSCRQRKIATRGRKKPSYRSSIARMEADSMETSGKIRSDQRRFKVKRKRRRNGIYRSKLRPSRYKTSTRRVRTGEQILTAITPKLPVSRNIQIRETPDAAEATTSAARERTHHKRLLQVVPVRAVIAIAVVMPMVTKVLMGTGADVVVDAEATVVATAAVTAVVVAAGAVATEVAVVVATEVVEVAMVAVVDIARIGIRITAKAEQPTQAESESLRIRSSSTWR